MVLAGAFAGAARKYWFGVFPRVCKEIHGWQHRARQIPDPVLRRLALGAQQAEQGNLEGAAAFAILVPRTHRAVVVRALVAFQAAYDYIDALVEQPSSDPALNGHQLHRALLTALDLNAPHPNYYAYHPCCQDAGYLRNLIDACRGACAALPSYASAALPALRAAGRMVVYQSLNHQNPVGTHHALAHWATTQTPLGTRLRWWETAAGSASSLAIFALIAAAAQPTVRACDTVAIENAYFPWVGALHVLLDSLIDRVEDVDVGQHCLVDHYTSANEAAARLEMIAGQAIRRTYELPHAEQHAMILAAMTGLYLSDPQASTPSARLAKQRVLATMGDLAAPTMLVMGARRAAVRLTRGSSDADPTEDVV
jgi:tetraprenyl-beta-curcumene synthase